MTVTKANPFGHIAESNAKYQNLIISIIIFIHFLTARLNAVSLPAPAVHSSIFSNSIALSTGDMWACQSHWLTAFKWPPEKQLISLFLFFYFLFWSDIVPVMPGPYQETQFNADKKEMPLTLTDSSQICRLQWRDFLLVVMFSFSFFTAGDYSIARTYTYTKT